MEVITAYSNLKLKSDDFLKLVSEIDNSDWSPIIFNSRKFFLQQSGVKDPSIEQIKQLKIIDGSLFPERFREYVADIFIDNGDVLYIINNSQIFSTYRPSLEVGLIALKNNNKLHSLVKVIKESVSKSIDGRKTRHQKLEWFEYKSNTKLESIKKELNTTNKKSHQEAELIDNETKVVNEIASNKTRKLIISISEAGFIREVDLKNKNGNEILESIELLINQNLISIQYLLQCRKTSTQLTKLTSETQLQTSDIGNLICAQCNSTYKDELVIKGYSLSNLGRKLISKSHWMTIWVTEKLVNLGVSMDSIIWNCEDSGEEIDILVEYKGQVWIFELKDKEFGAGNAHSFKYRRMKFKADKTIIITTEKISKEAKQVFEYLAKEGKKDKNSFIPIYIEGLNDLESKLGNLISEGDLLSVYKKANELSSLTGIDLSPIFESYFGKKDKRIDRMLKRDKY